RGAAQTANGAPVEMPPQTELKRTDPNQVENLELERAYVKRVEFLNLALKRYAPLAFSVGSGMKEKKPVEETFILVGGALSSRGEKAPPAVLSAPAVVPRKLNLKVAYADSPQLPQTVEKRRLGLARWIASPDNPLTSRVMVNRVWHYHFGRGRVNTDMNCGKLVSRAATPVL